MNLKHYFIALLLGCSFTVFSQDASFTAKVSKNKLGENQRLRVEFAVNQQGADAFTPPKFTNFTVISGPSQSVSQSWVNGKASYTQAYIYVLQPKKKGILIIAGATIELAGKKLTSNTVKIHVLKAAAVAKDPNNPNYVAQQNIHLVAEVSNTTPYVGECIYVEYRLYFSEQVGIGRNAVRNSPAYNGFWTQTLKKHGSPIKTGTYNGERYRYAVLSKALLIPTKAGKLTIDPMEMDIMVQVPTGRSDFFLNSINRSVQRAFSSTKKTIRVQPLPLAGKPANFIGAVGDFTFDVTTKTPTLKANESAEITVAIAGNGNLNLFELPTVTAPKELEVYAPERVEQVRFTSRGVKGAIKEVYTVVPTYKGKYKIPSTSFSYFNPTDKTYHSLSSAALFIEVLEGKEMRTRANVHEVQKQGVTTQGISFKYIATTTRLKSVHQSDFFGSYLFYCFLFFPFLAIPIALYITYKNNIQRSDITGNKQRKADRLAKKYLSKAFQKIDDKEAFYEALERALHNYLKAKLGIETTDIQTEKIAQILAKKQVDTPAIEQCIAVLKDCDFARYTPITDTMMQQEYEKATQALAALDKQL